MQHSLRENNATDIFPGDGFCLFWNWWKGKTLFWAEQVNFEWVIRLIFNSLKSRWPGFLAMGIGASIGWPHRKFVCYTIWTRNGSVTVTYLQIRHCSTYSEGDPEHFSVANNPFLNIAFSAPPLTFLLEIFPSQESAWLHNFSSFFEAAFLAVDEPIYRQAFTTVITIVINEHNT